MDKAMHKKIVKDITRSPEKYCGCLHELDYDDPRFEKYYKQYKKNGFDDTETWNLDRSIALFILPRLKRFKEVTNGCPGYTTERKWKKTLDKMIFAFEFICDGGKWYSPESHKKDLKKYKEGFRLFYENFEHLWW